MIKIVHWLMTSPYQKFLEWNVKNWELFIVKGYFKGPQHIRFTYKTASEAPLTMNKFLEKMFLQRKCRKHFVFVNVKKRHFILSASSFNRTTNDRFSNNTWFSTEIYSICNTYNLSNFCVTFFIVSLFNDLKVVYVSQISNSYKIFTDGKVSSNTMFWLLWIYFETRYLILHNQHIANVWSEWPSKKEIEK